MMKRIVRQTHGGLRDEVTKRRRGEDEFLLHFDEGLVRQVEKMAQRNGSTREEVVEQAVKEYLAKNASPEDGPLPPPKGG